MPLAVSYGISICNYLRNTHAVSTVAAPVYNPTNSAQESPLEEILIEVLQVTIFPEFLNSGGIK